MKLKISIIVLCLLISAVVFSAVSDFTIKGVLTVANTGLHIFDSNASHDLIIKPGSDLSADRELTITTGDAARTLTMTADASIPDSRINTLTNTKWCTTDGSTINCTSDAPALTPWTSDVDAAGYDLENIDDLKHDAVATDAAPRVMVLSSQPIYTTPGATNVTGANIVLAPSPGENTLEGVTKADTAGDTLTFSVYSNGALTTTVKTAGTDWVCAAAASDIECVCNLYTLLTGGGAITGVTVSRTDGTCSDEKLTFNITPGAAEYLNVATSDDTNMDMTKGADGKILLYQGSASAPALAFAAYPTNGFYNSNGSIGVAIGGTLAANWSGSTGAFASNSASGINAAAGPVTASSYISAGSYLQATTYVELNALDLTAATMTATQTGYLSTATAKYAWTNAMVLACQEAADTCDIKAVTLPAKTEIVDMYMIIDTAETHLTDLTISCGVTGANYDDLIIDSDGHGAANTVYGDAVGERGTNLTGYYMPSYTGTTDVYCHFETTDAGHTLDDALASTGHLAITTRLIP